MIIHHKDDFDNYEIRFLKKLKYSDDFTFIPIKIKKNKITHNFILQTPFLFAPYGIQETIKKKQVIDLSFLNKENDNNCNIFLDNLKNIYDKINEKYSSQFKVNHFLKNTFYNECMRLKINNSLFFDSDKNLIDTIKSFSYGIFIIQLHGLWINDNNIWIQWYLIQGKIMDPIHFDEYSFINELENNNNMNQILTKYDKMLKMGVPKEAIERQKLLDNHIPPPPPLPISSTSSTSQSSNQIPKIKAEDLQNIVLKKPKKINKNKQKVKNNNLFEPPSLEELQTTLAKLKKIN